jgi:hypothetical protein
MRKADTSGYGLLLASRSIDRTIPQELFHEKNTTALDSSFSRPLIFHGALSFVIDWGLWLILLGVRGIVFARSTAWHSLSTLLLAHLKLTSLDLSILAWYHSNECIYSIVLDHIGVLYSNRNWGNLAIASNSIAFISHTLNTNQIKANESQELNWNTISSLALASLVSRPLPTGPAVFVLSSAL